MKNIKILIYLTVIFILAYDVYAQSGRITDVKVAKENGFILVDTSLQRGITNMMEPEILNGIVKELFYYVVLKKKQRRWIDEEVAEITVKYSIKYDLLKKQFYVDMFVNEKKDESFILSNFSQVKDLVNKVRRIKVIDIQKLYKKKRYYVSVKAVMTKKLPFYIDYFFFFIPILEIDTPWKNSVIIRNR